MKLTEVPEPSMRRFIKPKNAKRKSYKVSKLIRSRAVRRALNRDHSLTGNIYKLHHGHEY